MQKVKIFIIDDEEEICKLSKSILEKTGRFEVMFSTKAIGAIDLIKSYKPDLILLDFVMPDMNGSIVAERLLEDSSTRDIPLVFLTALVEKSEIEETSGIKGGRFFIAKPVMSKELISRIDSILKIGK